LPKDPLEHSELIEFSVHAGCPIRCTPYCPQDLILKVYGNNTRMLTLENYKLLLKTVPKHVVIVFAGISEPFMNPKLTDMLIYTDKQGYRQALFTTLFNTTADQIKAISHIKFAEFVVHLPDGQHAKIPYSKQWAESLYAVAMLIPQAFYMSMNNNFKATNKELDKTTRRFRRFGACCRLRVPQMLAFPNGDVIPCCMLFTGPILGNLYRESYAVIRSRFTGKPYAPCHVCDNFHSLKRFWLHRIAEYVRSHLSDFK
jgi:MoaA/NifB/PqqE/SkfB family radical SAM enzyme